MNYDGPRQIERDGKPTGIWHYTRMRDKAVWPIGYCRENCDGHPSADEACAHYKKYLMDQAEFRGPKTEEWPKHKCAVKDCNNEAKHQIIIPGRMHDFETCEGHCNKEALETLLVVGESWHS